MARLGRICLGGTSYAQCSDRSEFAPRSCCFPGCRRLRDLSRLGARISIDDPPLAASHATSLIDAGGPDARVGVEALREAPDGTIGLKLNPADISPGFQQTMERLIGARQAA